MRDLGSRRALLDLRGRQPGRPARGVAEHQLARRLLDHDAREGPAVLRGDGDGHVFRLDDARRLDDLGEQLGPRILRADAVERRADLDAVPFGPVARPARGGPAARNRTRPRAASPVRASSAAGSIAWPSRFDRSASGRNRSSRSTTSGPAVALARVAASRPADSGTVPASIRRTSASAPRVEPISAGQRLAARGRCVGEPRQGFVEAVRRRGRTARGERRDPIGDQSRSGDIHAGRADARHPARSRAWPSGSRAPTAPARPGR